MRCLSTLVLLGTACSIWATPADGECIKFGPQAMKSESAAFVFDGTVLELTHSGLRPVALMQVHLVFRGCIKTQRRGPDRSPLPSSRSTVLAFTVARS